MNVEIGAEATLFPEKEYINGIAVAVRDTMIVNSYLTSCGMLILKRKYWLTVCRDHWRESAARKCGGMFGGKGWYKVQWNV